MDEMIKTKLGGWLVGAVCIATESPNGVPLLQFGSFKLWIPSSWRIIYEDRILISGDTDYNVLSEELSVFLIGKKIHTVETSGPFHDLGISFDGGARLEVFSDSGTHENWNVVGGPDAMIIAGPGASWSAF